MKTIALLGCLDTKESEFRYAAAEIEKRGVRTLIIDVSTSQGHHSTADYSRSDVSREAGVEWGEVEGGDQHKLLDLMARGSRSLLCRLFAQGTVHGVFSCGGLQNTTIAAHAMQGLPIGIPKLILSTVASGQRTFDSVVGARDIVTMPSISDFAGLNVVSRTVLDNAIAALVGMVATAGREIPRTTSTLIGATLMGATNDGVVNAINLVKARGYEVVSFHSTGAGGRCLEDLIRAGVVTAAMDLTLHEVVYEYFGHGFGYGPRDRLLAAIENRIPLLVCPAGIDFICQWRGQLFADADRRKIHWHNKNLAHVRLNATEISNIARIVVGRLNQARGNLKILVPIRGFRNYSRPGEALYDPDLDRLIVDIFRSELRDDIPIRLTDCNFMDREFSEAAADEMVSLIRTASHA